MSLYYNLFVSFYFVSEMRNSSSEHMHDHPSNAIKAKEMQTNNSVIHLKTALLMMFYLMKLILLNT